MTNQADSSCTLSVIIPTYNRSAMVRDCVRSLLSCGVAGLQVVVVDDGSTDDTEATVRALGDGVVYLRQQNQGPAAARNLGFRHSAGRYVAFLDDDDQWLPGVPARVLGLLDRHPDVDAVFADAQITWADKPPISWLDFTSGDALLELPHSEPEPGFRVFERRPFFRRLVYRNAMFIGAVVMRREAFQRAGMFDTSLRGAADWELWMRMAAGMTFAFWPEQIGVYRRHDDCMACDLEHMQGEFCGALAKCHGFAWQVGAEEGRYARSQLCASLFAHAYAAYDRGDYPEARRRFQAAAAASRFRLRPTLYFLLCLLPFGLPGRIRRLKQALLPT
jgi:glycosyltransferase involved in cell wall biosynthesis